MPSSIQFVEAGSLGRDALGAYDASNGGSLYLDRSLLSYPEKLQSVFNEEMGHHLDALLGGVDAALLGGVDAAGDEGAVFSRTLEQGTLSQSDLKALKSEDDHGVIQIGGRWVQVEFREEGGDDSGGSGSSSSGGTDSGGGECSVDSGGGNTGGGPSGSESTGNDEGGRDSGDTGGECSVDEGNDNGSTPGTDDTDDPDENTGDHQNGNSDSDKAGGTKGANSTDAQANGVQADGLQTGGGAGDTPGADTEPTTEPKPEEEKGFWSRALDAVQTGLDVAGFVPGFGVLPDMINAGISLVRGDKVRAGESLIAAIPIGGDAFKAGKMGMRAIDGVSVTRKGLGSSRQEVREYLKNVDKIPREQLVKDLEAAGFKNVFDDKGMQHFKRGNWNVRLDPPQGKTNYDHMHINRGGNRNAFDANLKPTPYKSPDAHMEIQGQ